MIKSILLLSCALTLGQTANRAEWQLAPQLLPGLELVYSGTYIEESLLPNVQYQRQYRLESNLLVFAASEKDWHVAIMTGLSLQDTEQKRTGPTSVRLSQAKVDRQGRVYTSDKKPLELPLAGPPTLESGCFVPAPFTQVGRNFTWEVVDAGRPSQHWQVLGTEACGGVTCIKVAGVQQSDDWDRSRADQTAWRRRDTLWMHPLLNVAQKVERIIEQRAAARDTPTHRTTVRYELDSHLRYPGQLFEERKQAVLKACKFYDDAQLLVRQPVLYRAQIDSMIQRVSYQLEHQEPTPYSKAILHVKATLENAKKGEAPPPAGTEEPAPITTQVLSVGQRVPDFTVSSFTEQADTRLRSHVGKPVLIFFYNPSTPLGKEVVEYVKQLSLKEGNKVGIMAMAVTQDADEARKQHHGLRLPFPLLDGNAMRLSLGATETPRFVLTDGEGTILFTQTGWGIPTPYEIEEKLQRCLKK